MRAEFTPVERAMLIMLSDGHPHSRDELYTCLSDDLAPTDAIRYHVFNLRRKLEPKGIGIRCERTANLVYYRQVTLLAPAADGRR